ncbi:uncharacterized protein LTHEOB_12918 [Lasiodiplodia theobromae]|uniref:uncharacterized protein n=1 Tax=Lasiodiplodia theobromae TaxID=45133 RepID=UPI0015C39A63|nr:uncharacterized protein LTHEOB_12918 [Lasiodiplodia theobromae]KAF4534640.1 hypothetical protein LTHEOB_12918 [Lasiodiplodia theobromae]
MLDEQHRKPLDFTQPPNDKNSYTWGRISDHNIVIASLPAGVYGTTSAATTATSMLSSFPQIRIGLMVGIGAGIPRLEDDVDIRLGDIVVSQPSGKSGGVVQYDFGKAKASDRFERTGFLNSPPQALLNALANLQAQHEFGPKVPKILEEMLEKNPQLAKANPGKPSYAYQGREHDKLFKPTYHHSQGRNCNKCDPEQEIKREARDSQDPEIHYGLIASGNTLVKDATVRDSILKEVGDDCICFEMEAAGLMNSFPCLVIRGICDYADSHKNDRWQRYAAAAAAAYGKEFLGIIPGDDLEKAQRAMDIMTDIANTVEQTHSIVKNTSIQQHDERINKWLSPPDPSANYNKALQQRNTGSGQWFLTSAAYSKWKIEENSFLWLHGIPGCGKTILSSTIVDDLQNNAGCSPLYFYFDFNDTSKQSLEKAVRSLIIQLCGKSNGVQKHVDSLYSSCENGTMQPSIDSLCKTFHKMVQEAGEVWIILDALDECQTRKGHSAEGLLSWMESIRSSQQTNVHILATSRPEQDIKSAIEKWNRKQVISIQSDLVANDIDAYIHTRVRQHTGLSRWQKKPDVQKLIEVTLSNKADGMFRWVALQLDSLEQCVNNEELEDALEHLPDNLYETYDRILDNIPLRRKKNAIRLLQFLVYSERPLTLKEAVDAITVKLDGSPRFDIKRRMPDHQEIAVYCSGLVTVISSQDKAVTEIQLAHFSVKEYLVSDQLMKSACEEDAAEMSVSRNLAEPLARGSIAEVCLEYLFELKRDLPAKEIRQSFFLAQYSARYWIVHAIVAENGSETVRALASKLFLDGSFYKTWCRLYNPDRPWDDEADEVQALLDKGADVNAQGGHYGNALQAASEGGHVQVVQILLKKGADVYAQGGEYGNALQAASSRGHVQVVQMLLDKGANFNGSTTNLRYMLQSTALF